MASPVHPLVSGTSTLLVFQLVGELLVRWTGVPVPGPVIGMVLLFMALRIAGRTPPGLALVGKGLLGNLSLLFVPATVGAMFRLPSAASEWAAIVVAVVLSTIVTMVVTALSFAWLEPRLRAGSPAKEGS